MSKRKYKDTEIIGHKNPAKMKKRKSKRSKANGDARNDKRRILQILKDNEDAPDILTSAVIKKIEANENIGDIMEFLKQLFPSEKYKSPEYKHCVRCHNKFDINDKNSRCLIDHIEEFDDYQKVYDRRTRKAVYIMNAWCCGLEFKVDHPCGAEAPGYCFEGAHTTNPHEIVYNEYNIIQCEENGCNLENDA